MRELRAILWATTLCLGLGLSACTDDPQDPKTWIKKLDDVREQKEAVRQLAHLKDGSAYPALEKLFKRTKDPEHLSAITKLRTDQAVDLLVDQLDYSDESYDNASVAATGLAEIAERDDKGREAAKKAVPALSKAVTKKLPIKTRANIVKLEAMKTLAAIKDPAAVEALDQVLETSADEQDFFLNKEAARHLADFADQRSVPTLVRGLFMTGRGKDIFQTCRLALVRIGGDAALDKLVEAMQRKNQALEADAKKYEFIPGIVVQKTSIVIGDLRNPRAIKPLLDELNRKDDGLAPGGVSGRQFVIQALGLIGDPSVAKTLAGILLDPKRHNKHRVAAAAALNFLGATDALPALLAVSRTPYLNLKTKVLDTEKGGLAMQVVTEYGRLADSDVTTELIPLVKAAPEGYDVQIAFRNALARALVVKECGKDVACYGKVLGADSSAGKTEPEKVALAAKSEKAAFMLGRLGHAAVPVLQKSVAHKDSATRFAVLFSLTRVANKGDKEVIKTISDQVDLDKTKPPLMPLVDEMRITQAIIERR